MHLKCIIIIIIIIIIKLIEIIIILKRIFKTWDGDLDRIDLAQDRALVNAAMNLWVA
jgi:hypothetical protein